MQTQAPDQSGDNEDGEETSEESEPLSEYRLLLFRTDEFQNKQSYSRRSCVCIHEKWQSSKYIWTGANFQSGFCYLLSYSKSLNVLESLCYLLNPDREIASMRNGKNSYIYISNKLNN